MALTRKFLAALGIEPEKIDEIVTAHTETVDGLKAERDKLREMADKLPEVEKKLAEAESQLESGNGYKEKYEAEKAAHEKTKAEITNRAAKDAKTTAFKALLKEAGISEKRLDAVLKVSDVDSIELDKDGGIKGKDKLLETVKTEWADFITTTTTSGAQTANPPTSTSRSPMTRDEIYKRDDAGRFVYTPAQRQQALADLMKG